MNIEKAVCKHCGRDVPWYAKKEHEAICDTSMLDKVATVRGATDYRSGVVTIVPKDNGRKCVVCGEGCSPNYWYCNRHIPDDLWIAG